MTKHAEKQKLNNKSNENGKRQNRKQAAKEARDKTYGQYLDDD